MRNAKWGIKKQAPNLKHQIPNKLQWPKTNNPNLSDERLLRSLILWKLDFIWDLEFGAWDFKSAIRN
jgi:hypothetical protein